MRHRFAVRIGPRAFRIGSDWAAPIRLLERLYAGYPGPEGGICDFTVRLFAPRPWRRVVRPQVAIGGDFVLPGTLPLPLDQALLAAEMGMNLQLALGERRWLLLHASAVERDGRALVMTGHSGSGKSTLAALLAARGWRFLSDEFVLVDTATGVVRGFPRLVSLKNEGIAAVEAALPGATYGPLMPDTPKGWLRHLRPPDSAIAAMDEPARPAAVLFPRFGFAPAERAVLPAECFARLTEASTNYVALGERGFGALTRLVGAVPAFAVDYPDIDAAEALVEAIWTRLA